VETCKRVASSKGVPSQRDLNYFTKTKEMIVGANVNPPPQLIFNDEIIERVFVYKLLGVLIDTNLKWDNHIEYVPKPPQDFFYLLN